MQLLMHVWHVFVWFFPNFFIISLSPQVTNEGFEHKARLLENPTKFQKRYFFSIFVGKKVLNVFFWFFSMKPRRRGVLVLFLGSLFFHIFFCSLMAGRDSGCFL